jgi:hypothetical protein
MAPDDCQDRQDRNSGERSSVERIASLEESRENNRDLLREMPSNTTNIP